MTLPNTFILCLLDHQFSNFLIEKVKFKYFVMNFLLICQASQLVSAPSCQLCHQEACSQRMHLRQTEKIPLFVFSVGFQSNLLLLSNLKL